MMNYIYERFEHCDASCVGADNLEFCVLESEFDDTGMNVGSARLGRVRESGGGGRQVEMEE